VTRARIWTDDQLIRVAAEVTAEGGNLTDVVVALGLGPYAVNRQTVKRHAARLQVILPRDPRGRRCLSVASVSPEGGEGGE
jgi:hypothetical protein